MKPRKPVETRIREEFDAALLDMSEGRQGVRANRRRIKKRMSKVGRLIGQAELEEALDSDDV
jgi:hypothetical protein